MFQRVSVNAPSINENWAECERSGMIVSAFFTLSLIVKQRHFTPPEIAQEESFQTIAPQLFPVNLEAAAKFTVLNRYELEGSLINCLLSSPCIDEFTKNEDEARQNVRRLLECIIFPRDILIAYRMDDCRWSKFSDRSTLSWSYFIYESNHRLWWTLNFADFY